MLERIKPNGRFLASGEDLSRARIVVAGAPLDVTASFRPGAREGPMAIRLASCCLETYSPNLDRDLEEVLFFDAGDLELVGADLGPSLGQVEELIGEIAAAKKKPLLLGGEHLVTLPAVEAMLSAYPDLAVLQMDAHADLRPEYLGQALSHACVMCRVAEKVGAKNLFQLGIRSGTREEWQWGARHTRFYPYQLLAPLAQVKPQLANRSIYLTVDIDVVDPAYAPGTGSPEPEGVTAAELLEAVRNLSGLRVVGADIVEVAPAWDPSQRTALLAAKVARELLLGVL